MRIVTLITALLLSLMTIGQKPLGLEKFTDDMETYDYGFKSDDVPSAIYIATVISELKRVLDLNGRTLDSYDGLIPENNEFNSFSSEDIQLEMIAGFHVGFRYVIGEYSIYMYATDYDIEDYSVGFMVEKTIEY